MESYGHKLVFVEPRSSAFVKPKTSGFLPHLHKPGGTYFLTFRLADAVVEGSSHIHPHNVVADSHSVLDVENVVSHFEPAITLGSCLLREPRFAEVVQDAILHFEAQRYGLYAWCVMPNHVHVVVKPFGNNTLAAILQSWKGYSARLINELRGGAGPVWEKETFDHLIRTPEAVRQFIAYVDNNPVMAKLVAHKTQWPYSSAGAGFVPGQGLKAKQLL